MPTVRCSAANRFHSFHGAPLAPHALASSAVVAEADEDVDEFDDDDFDDEFDDDFEEDFDDEFDDDLDEEESDDDEEDDDESDCAPCEIEDDE